MEKEEAVKLLVKNGYSASFESGVPMVVFKGREKELKSVYSAVTKLLRENGYLASYGVKCKADTPSGSTSDSTSFFNENPDGQLSFL